MTTKCLLCGVKLPPEYVANEVYVCHVCEDECESDAEEVLDSMFYNKRGSLRYHEEY